MSDPDFSGLNVSRETQDRLIRYRALLEKWNPTINLVARSTLADAWTRHFLDSAQLMDFCPAEATHWVDLGSGGGFPGLVVAILAAEAAPQMRVTLIESDRRKATFLRTVARDLEIAPVIVNDRIEAAPPQTADILSARALAPLPRLLDFAARHLAPGGKALLPKGASHMQDISDALAKWRFDVQKYPSRTDPGAVILKIEGLSRV